MRDNRIHPHPEGDRMKIRTLAILALVLALVTLGPAQNAPKPDYDILIKNGQVYDGSLDPPARLDVAVKGDKIVKIAPSIGGTAARTIDAAGMIVTPGFIDLHTHVDEGMYFPENRACLNFLTQGVTSVILGQCGGSAWPIFEQAEDLIGTWTRDGIGPNAALLVGHGQVRQIVMGMENRAPTN
jgi:N-acyl-D-amino-acid deacylase